jgi:DNA-binding NarL/FixJ family response regulator
MYKRSLPGVEVLLLTAEDDQRTVSSGLKAGALGCLPRSEPVAHLLGAIAALSERRSFFSPTIRSFLFDAARGRSGSLPKPFTGRELEVMQLICEGERNRAIARRLSLSIKTVATHRESSMRKAGAHNAGELVRFAIKNKLVDA